MTVSGIFEKLGSLGTIVSAMGCAACFPALASLGASIGLGFLSAYEGVFINKLLPLFAIIVLVILCGEEFSRHSFRCPRWQMA